jgi:O-antigen/teichoic acid export membrane protein/thymidylate kinase
MTQASTGLTKRTLGGLLWTSLGTGAQAVLQLLVLAILARLLSPADFGLAAAALVVVGLSAVFSELGIGPAVVQRLDLQPAHLRSAFTLSVLLGLLLGGLIWGTAPLVAGFFRLDGLTPLLRALAFVFPVQGLSVVADSLLQRELRFRGLAAVEVTTVAVGYGVAGIPLAVLGFGAWALVGAHLAQNLLRTVLLFALRPHPVRPLLAPRACADLLYFGGGYTAARLSNYVAGQGDNLVVGRWLGAEALGMYGRAYQLMAGPAVLFGNVLDRVLFPTMAQLQDQPERLADAYRRGVALIALVMLPASAALVLLAPELTAVVLGSEWHSVVVPLQILGAGLLFRTSYKLSDSLARATGAVYRRSWRQAAYAVAVLASAWVGHFGGLAGVSLAVLATLGLNFLLMAHLSLRLSGLSWRRFAAAHLPGLALAALVGASVWGATALLRARGLPPVLVLAGCVAATAPALVLVCRLPRLFLGEDGQWMMRKLTAHLLEGLRTARPARTGCTTSFGWGGRRRAPYEGRGTNVSALSTQYSVLSTQYPVLGTPRGPAEEPSSEPITASPGDLLAQLVSGLAREGVRYCRWKRQLDLPRVLRGAGDLDLLVDCGNVPTFLAVAERLGLRMAACGWDPRPEQEFHLYGLDPAAEGLIHLHLNIRLLDDGSALEELVLRHASPAEDGGPLAGMPVVQPQAELVALVVRTMLPYGRLSAYPMLFRRGPAARARVQEVLAEYTAAGTRELLERGLPDVPPALFDECVAVLVGPASWFRRFRLARRLAGRLGVRRRWFDVGGTLHGARALLAKGWWRLLHGRAGARCLTSGGAVLALVGPEACGKSTLVADTVCWLGQAVRVRPAHLGKPPSTWLTLLPNLAGRLLGRLLPRLRPKNSHAAVEEGPPLRPGLLYGVRAVLLAWDRCALARRLARDAARGWLVVCDRYPSTLVGAADSARLPLPGGEGRCGLAACLATLEQVLYRRVPPPALILELTAPLAVAIERNRERLKAEKESDGYVTTRHRDFVPPSFPGTPTVVLDTNESRPATVAACRRAVWRALGDGLRGTGFQSCQGPTGLESCPTNPAGTSTADDNGPLLVEFIGATGAGKSTLVAALLEALEGQGLRVCEAHEAILARYGLAFVSHPGARSALVSVLSLFSFGRSVCTREGFQLWRLAVRAIARDAGGLGIGAGLLRNVVKRIGVDRSLRQFRPGLRDYDVIVCDEGLVHAAHNLFVHAGPPPRGEEIALFGALVPRPDLLVWVTASPAQSAAVIRQRGHTRVTGTAEAAPRFARHSHETFEALAAVPRLGERISRIDNSARGGASAVAALVADIVERLRQPGRPVAASGTLAATGSHPISLRSTP